MANEVLTKYGASTALDFSTLLNSLAAGSIVWSAPVTDASPSMPRVMIHYQITAHSTAPAAGGTVEFYLSRADDNATEVRDGSDLGTLTDHEDNATAANVARARQNLQLVGMMVCSNDANIVYTGSFVIDEPGTDWNLVVYNGMSQICAAAGNLVNYRVMCSEIQ
jgi:hypothetical protein